MLNINERNIKNLESDETTKLRADILIIKAVLGIKDELKPQDLVKIIEVGEEIESIAAGAGLMAQVTFLAEQVNQLEVDEEYILNWQKYSVLISAGFTLDSLNQILNRFMELKVVGVVENKSKRENLEFKIWFESILSSKIKLESEDDRNTLSKYIKDGKVDLEKFIKIRNISQKTFTPNSENAKKEEYLPIDFYLNSSPSRRYFSFGYEYLKWKTEGILDLNAANMLSDFVKQGVVLKEELEAIKKATSENGSGINLSSEELPEILLSDEQN